MLRRGREVLLRVAVEMPEVVRLVPTRAGQVRAGDRVLARTGLLPDGPGALVLAPVTAVRADMARLENASEAACWVLLENIFGKVVPGGK